MRFIQLIIAAVFLPTALLLAVSRATYAAALTPIRPTLALDFEGDANATGLDGQSVASRVEGALQLRDGRFGRALLSGPGGASLHFPAPGHISPRQGTVEMWVSPLDWNGTEEAFHMFFQADGTGSLYFYKYHAPVFGLLILSNNGAGSGNFLTQSTEIHKWKAGEWHHIAATWSQARQEVFIDGVRVASGPSRLPQALDGEFLVGDHPFNPAIPRTSNSLIDRVRVYDRVLSAQTIAAHFAGDYAHAAPLASDSAQLDYTAQPDKKQFTARLALLGAGVETPGATVDFSLMQGERVVAQKSGAPLREARAEAVFSSEVPAAEYSLRALVRDRDGGESGRVSAPLIVPSLAWMNSTLGEEKKVLAPWTPLAVKRGASGFSVAPWGREYRFGSGAFPLQIVAKGQPMLQRPISLDIVSGGQKLRWKPQTARVQKSSGYAVDVVSGAVAETPAGRVTLSTTSHIEYDGLMWTTMRLQTPPGFRAQSIALDIPQRVQNALYRHGWDADLKPFSGALPTPDAAGVLSKGTFHPANWLGDNERGLFWFCESGEKWPNYRGDNAYQLVRDQGAIALRLTLLQNGAPPANWNFEFGLQATPVKPLPTNWRKWRLPPAPKANLVIPWPSDQPDSTRYFGYAQATDAARFQKMIDDFRAQGLGVVPYSLLTGLSSEAPEWKWFGPTWDSKIGEPVHNNAFLHYTTPTTETWRDFIVGKNKEFFEKFKFAGVYHDLTYAFGWAVPESGTGWFDGKEWQKTYPLRAYRELYRRHYAVTKSINPNAFMMAHMSPAITIPVLAYEDAYLNGETLLNALKGKESYMDVMTLAQWRSDYTGRQWGVMPFLLPEFDETHRAQTRPTRGLAALVMLHDTGVWPIWSNAAVWIEMYNALDAFGHLNAEFIPYWDMAPPASTDMPDVYISVYKRSDGRALAVIGNTSKEARSGTVTFSSSNIGLNTSQLMNWPEKTPLANTNGTASISLAGLDYKLVLIGTPPAPAP